MADTRAAWIGAFGAIVAALIGAYALMSAPLKDQGQLPLREAEVRPTGPAQSDDSPRNPSSPTTRPPSPKRTAAPTDDLAAPSSPEPPEPIAESTPLERMVVLGTPPLPRKDTQVLGLSYPDSWFFPDESLIVAVNKKYRRLHMKVGVDDEGHGTGGKDIKVVDQDGRVLATGSARVGKAPTEIVADVSRADSVKLDALFYNGQPPQFIRWINVRFE